MDKSKKYHLFGRIVTVQQFINENADALANADDQKIQATIDVLVRKGHMKEVDTRTKDEKKMMKAAQEELIRAAASGVEQQGEDLKDYKAELKRENRLSYEEIELDFPNATYAMQFEEFCKSTLRIKETEIRLRNGMAILAVKNITDAELNAINRKYTADKVVSSTVGVMDKTAEGLTKAVDYAAKNVLTPVTSIAAKSGMSILKSLAGTVARTGATLVTAGSKGLRDTIHDIKNDPEILRANRDLIDAKDTIRRTVVGASAGTNSGIRVIR